MSKTGALGFIVFLIFGLYLLNKFFNLVNLSVFASLDRWVFLIGGALLIIGGFYFWKEKRY